ncbi:hypothetical protein HELRODRAFT_80150 [Helobdella robusta]|uniref:G-protein coupled receptors family 1 profile domain-containing protein n=1 Tax=Helobdella robusta TaxID=6412 RepID=T1G3Y3_HELRO|nr:hypothetical protein HELRODRAFT_80150 [Helobdella robusta]ESO03781.1 hypothetical protein HELRODRAFT_80150 [Helobdella robusta]
MTSTTINSSKNTSSTDFLEFPNSKNSNWSHTYTSFRHATDQYSSIHGYVASFVCCWGIPANLATILVLTRPKMAQSSTNFILVWLAVADLITMATFLPISIYFYAMKSKHLPMPSTSSYAWIGYFIFAINSVVTWHTIAIWLTISLAIFRYIFICYPTNGLQWCNKARAKTAVGWVFCCCVLLCVPNYFLTEVHLVKRADEGNIIMTTTKSAIPMTLMMTSNFSTAPITKTTIISTTTKTSKLTSVTSTATTITLTTAITSTIVTFIITQSRILFPFQLYTRLISGFNLFSNFETTTEKKINVQALLFKLLPCILLTALTFCLVAAMREASVRRCKLKSQGNRVESDRAAEHQRTTAMLLAVVGLFLVTEFPQGLLTLLSIFSTPFHHDYYQPLGDILDIAALINNSINFILYCVMSRQFRDTFKELFLDGCAAGSGAGGGR